MATFLKAYSAKRYRKFKANGTADIDPNNVASLNHSTQSDTTEVSTNALTKLQVPRLAKAVMRSTSALIPKTHPYVVLSAFDKGRSHTSRCSACSNLVSIPAFDLKTPVLFSWTVA